MARQLRTQLIVGLTDKASGPAARIASALQRLKTVGQMNIGQRMGMAANTMKRSSVAATGLGVGLGLVARQGFMAAYNLEKVMNKLEAVGQLSKGQRHEFQGLALDLNNKFPYTSTEIAEAGVELMKAGLSFAQTKGALEETLRMAMAGDIGRGEAADIATNVLTAMRLPMETAEQVQASLKRVVDNLAYAATKSNTDISKMGETFKYVAPIAAAAGISIEKVGAMSMVMANNGIKASEAGVALRAAIVKMVKPTTFATKAFARLKINVGDFVKSGRQISSEDIIGGLELDGLDVSGMKTPLDHILSDKALQNKPAQLAARITDTLASALGDDSIMGKAKLAESIQNIVTASAQEVDLLGIRKALVDKGASLGDMANIFGTKQAARLMTLLTADIDKIASDVAVNSVGAAARMAEKMMQGIIKTSAELKAAWEKLWVKIGESGVLNAIAQAFGAMARGLEQLSQTSPELLKFGTYALGALAVLGPLGFMMTGVAASVTMLGAALSLTGLGIAGLGRAMAGPFVAAAVGARRQLLLLNVAASMGSVSRFSLLAGSFMAMLNPLNWLKKGFSGAGFALRGLLAGAGLLAAISWPVVLGVTAIAGVIGYWQELKAFFSGFFSGIDDAFASEGLGRPLQAIADIARGLMSTLGNAIDYVKQLFGFGGDDSSLKSWFSAGEAAARGMAAAVKAILSPLIALKNLISAGVGKVGSLISGEPKVEARARGGNVRAGMPYLVGERGPELITPSRNGFVLPNHKLGRGAAGGRSVTVGNVTVNVNANSPVNNAKQFGQEVGRAVRNAVADKYSDGGFA